MKSKSLFPDSLILWLFVIIKDKSASSFLIDEYYELYMNYMN